MVLGFIALVRLPVDLYPSVSYPVLMVQADLPGAAPEEVEQLVTKKMEDALSTVAGLQTLRSSSRQGSAMVMMEFNIGEDVRFQEIQVRGKIANLKKKLPDNMSEPVIHRRDPDDQPIIELAVTGERSASELTKIADDLIAKRIRQISGVGQVDLVGSRDEEIDVDLHEEALDTWRINAKDVATAIQKFNRNDPVGTLEGQERSWVLRSISQAKSVVDLGEISVGKTSSDDPILLKDVATITAAYADPSRITNIGDKKGLRPTVLIRVLKQSGENTVAISDRVTSLLEEIKKDLPGDVTAIVTRDNADLVRSNVNDVFESLVLGILLTVLVVLLFLRSPRSTLTTGLSLPSSIITTFAIMAIAAFTVNVMTLLALSLAIGLLVDDAIVVRENIFRHLHMKEKSPIECAKLGAEEVSLAVVATTLTVIAVFLPVGFMGGVSGQFFKQFAITVVFAIAVSLWDALTMAPMLSAYFANIPDVAKEWAPLGKVGDYINRGLNVFEEGFEKSAHTYRRMLSWLLPRPWAAAILALISVSIALGGFRFVKKNFVSTQLGKVFSASLQGPLAVPIDRVLGVTDEVQKRLASINELDFWTINTGGGHESSANIEMTVRIKPEFVTNQKTLAKVRASTRKALQGLPGYSIRMSEPADPLASMGGRYQPIAVAITGDDIGEIQGITKSVRKLMREVPGIVDVQEVQDDGLPEIRLQTDAAMAAHFGVTAATVSETLQTWVEGDTSNSFRTHDDQIPIRVRLQNGKSLSPTDLLARNLYVKNPNFKTDVAVPMMNLVKWEAGVGPTVIGRENRQRMMRIGGNISQNVALGDIVKDLQKKLDTLPLPSGYSARIAGQNEQMSELFNNVLLAIIMGCIFIYMVLAALFESFVQPITVMAAIPLAAAGAVFALMLFGLPLDLYGGIGMILLAGIVAKNSILLVDFAMQRVRDHGYRATDAILESAPIRLRPILMTSFAMIAGMIPIAMGWGVGGATRQSLGVAAIGGIISSTVLTLLIVPSLYILIERFSRRSKKTRVC